MQYPGKWKGVFGDLELQHLREKAKKVGLTVRRAARPAGQFSRLYRLGKTDVLTAADCHTTLDWLIASRKATDHLVKNPPKRTYVPQGYVGVMPSVSPPAPKRKAIRRQKYAIIPSTSMPQPKRKPAKRLKPQIIPS